MLRHWYKNSLNSRSRFQGKKQYTRTENISFFILLQHLFASLLTALKMKAVLALLAIGVTTVLALPTAIIPPGSDCNAPECPPAKSRAIEA